MGFNLDLLLIFSYNFDCSNLLFFARMGEVWYRDLFSTLLYASFGWVRNTMENNYHFLMLLHSWEAISGAHFSTLVRAIGLRVFFFPPTGWLQQSNYCFLYANKCIFKSYWQRDIISSYSHSISIHLQSSGSFTLINIFVKKSIIESSGLKKQTNLKIIYSKISTSLCIWKKISTEVIFKYTILHKKEKTHNPLISLK